MNGEVNGATLPDDDTYESEDNEEIIKLDPQQTKVKRDIPKLFTHCSRLYKLLDQHAVGEEGAKIYVGSISPLVVSLNLASSYQSKLISRLKDMGSIAMLKRGSGAAKSVWGVYKPPTLDDFYNSDNTGDVKWRQERTLRDEQTQRIKDLNRRVSALEDFAREKGMIV